jgi:hypothetical protein
MLRLFTAFVIVLSFVARVWAGPAEDAALLEAARKLDIVAVKAALERGANPNAASFERRRLTALGALTFGMVRDSGSDAEARH